MERWAGLRNVLAHLYLDVDHGRLHQILTSELGSLEEYAAALSRTVAGEAPRRDAL
jgi:uncharacterized protein YutE (UPF0331/DUF86 family)